MSKINYSVVPYSSEFADDIARLFRQEGFERSREYLNWIFSPPAGRGLVALASDGASNGRIVGTLGLVPRDVLVGGEVRKTYLAIDLVVDREYRGRGIFMGLGKAGLDAAEAAGGAFVWGFPNSNAAHAWFNRFGWLRLGALPLMIRPLRSGFFARKLRLAAGQLDFPLVRRSAGRPPSRIIERFGPETDALWARVSRDLHCSTLRDSSWLNWRTVDAPENQYRRAGAMNGDTLAALVITSCVQKRGTKLLYVMEAMSAGRDSNRLLSEILHQELSLAAAHGVDLALCWSPRRSASRSAFRRAGFIPLPRRLHPSETHFGVKAFAGTPDAATRPDGWYISFLDSDAL